MAADKPETTAPKTDYPSFGREKRLWFAPGEKEPHQNMVETIDTILAAQSAYRERTRYFTNLYYNFQATATDPSNFYVEGGFLKYNLSQACVDTAASLVLANKPVPFWQTTEGTWKEQRSAKKCTQYVTGQFYRLGVHQLMKRTVMDGLRGGLGVAYGYIDEDNLAQVEHLHPLQWIQDHDEALWGRARSGYIVRPIAKEVLMAQSAPEHWDAIARAPAVDSKLLADLGMLRDSQRSEMTCVYEGWHLPTIKGFDDGRYVRAIVGRTLRNEKFEQKEFPVSTYKGWADRMGYVGQGLIERVRGDQERLNALMAHIEALYTLGSNTWVFTDRQRGVKAKQLGNKPLQIVPIDSDKPPTVVTVNAIPPELLTQVDRLVEGVIFREGLNAQAMAGEKPTGVSSGIGLQVAIDSGDRRQLLPMDMVEQHGLGFAKLIVRLTSEAAKKSKEAGKPYMVGARVRRGSTSFARKFDYGDLCIDPDNPSVALFPMSSVATTPAGKFQQVDEMTNRGWIDVSFAMELRGMPDTDAFCSIQTSDQDYTQYCLEEILDGNQKYPDPEQDLQKCAKLCLQYKFKALECEADDEVIEGLAKYTQAVKYFQTEQVKAQQAAMGALQGGGAPGGTPQLVQPSATPGPAPGAAPAPGLRAVG